MVSVKRPPRAAGARALDRLQGPGRQRFRRAYAANLALNAGWTAIFFGARQPKLALLELLALDAANVALLRRAWRAGAAALRRLDRLRHRAQWVHRIAQSRSGGALTASTIFRTRGAVNASAGVATVLPHPASTARNARSVAPRADEASVR
jgi:hypothetical protein